MLPQLRKLEARFPDELVIIGVHAGKFYAERLTPNIRQAVLRLRVDHPVVNDRYFRLWRAYGISAWPTLVLIDPNGRIVGAHAGEIAYESYESLVQNVVSTFSARGQLSREPLPLQPEKAREPERPLSFPGKVLTVAPNQVFIADSTHHRLIWAELDLDVRKARVRAVAGSGQPGLLDGPFSASAFRYPQGMALDGDRLFVADTENHAIRVLDLNRREVKTVAGTGEQARGSGLGFTQPARLSSPWDVRLIGSTLYIAMAGRHQIWSMDLASGDLRPFAGSGAEDLYDAPARQAALAQPSGLAGDEDWLYFADSESSAIRRLQARPGSRVETLVGAGLFDFGDRDGVGDEARLQHPLGVAYHEGNLYVADTYNNRIKVLDPATRRIASLAGSEEAGLQDGYGAGARFWEPGGLSVLGDQLYIADTNNHLIRMVDITSGLVSTLELSGLAA